jgi:hypothetical protein
MGVGTELKLLLHRIGINATKGCLCDQRALVMDEEGPDWCKKNLALINSWLQEEAEARGMPFNSLAAKALVLYAIRRARKKERILSRA